MKRAVTILAAAVTLLGACAHEPKPGSYAYCRKKCQDKFAETFVWHTGPYRDCMDGCRTPWWDR